MEKFPGFPYSKPYSIQIDFMNALYTSLDLGGISMLESPTGTGKTLSIICSALQWLVDTKDKQKIQVSVESDNNNNNNRVVSEQCRSDDEPDWMKNFAVHKEDEASEKKDKVNRKLGFRSNKVDKGRKVANFTEIKGYKGDDGNVSKLGKKGGKVRNEEVELGDEEFLVEEYESGEEEIGMSKRKAGDVLISSSSDEDRDEDQSDDEEEKAGIKIYFCSRTHSQLSQFVKELRKTVFASTLKVVNLGSRKNLCINEEVLKLGNPGQINERCLELQKNKKGDVSKMKNLGTDGRVRRTKASCKCPMLRKRKQKNFKRGIKEQDPLDIEDLVHLGTKLGACPYYGSRSMVPGADLVILPYQSLLSKSSRESLGLNLKNNIVIIDEAHNLADSLISMYDSKVTSYQMEHVLSQLEMYIQRFCNMLGPGNRRYIQIMIVLARAFLQTLCKTSASDIDTLSLEDSSGSTALDSSMAINEFLFALNIDNINLVKLLEYIKESNIIHKVSGYGDKASSQKGSAVKGDGETVEQGSTLSCFRAFVGMLVALTNNNGDGRMIISRTRSTCSGKQVGYLKYVMLTGEKIFSEIVDQAHAVIMAGGTLQPVEETKERLFPSLPPDQFHFFSCGHIVPSENILPIAVSHGPSGQSFDFSYSCRGSSVMVEELGLLLCNLVTVIPEGIVVFFSSFDYEGQVYDAWKASGIVARITKKKRIFREPRKSTDVETVLKEYKETIEAVSCGNIKHDLTSYTGAILLAVVGGKISEGINFSDGMGRCIVMVGLPYPSPSDVELIERIKHIEGLGDVTSNQSSKYLADAEYCTGNAQAGFEILRSCKRRGREYYDNLCMKAVNQSIGRAIRHINDYAAILLVDSRYASGSSKRIFAHPTDKLPQWIKGRLISATGAYGDVHRELHQFFKLKKLKG
ncbi:DNA helicase [Heracleum sosnowskyi]|uniref:DNA helicase n=1 Tax=Heracleum sosnowskyi TaxID=360622 RepID=A0AAD8M5I4_9APIA|nr:DNA helicase [Heracleum sosnowskyi]